jgi:hypothetical protein
MRDMVEHPTIRALADHLEQRRGAQQPPAAHTPAASPALVTPASQPVRSPLSEGQRGLWTLQQLVPEMSAYNIPLCFHIAQAVNGDALEAAFRHVLARHPMLRSRFIEDNGALVREAQPVVTTALQRHDASGLDTKKLLADIRAAAATPFDLETAPLARIHLFSHDARDHYVLITLHHIVFDGGSFLPVCRDLFSAYWQILQGSTPAPLEAADLYPAFVRRAQEMQAGADGAQHRAYWREQLSGGLPVLSLPTDFPRAAARPFAAFVRSRASRA